jgi:PAS domain S-box-containing protein
MVKTLSNMEKIERLTEISSEIKRSLELNHLEQLGKNFPSGCLIRLQIDVNIIENTDKSNLEWLKHWKMVYAGAAWSKISTIPLQDAMKDFMLPISQIFPGELERIIPLMHESLANLTLFNVEVPYRYSERETRWLELSTHPRREGKYVVSDGFMLDITRRKQAEIELEVHRNELQLLLRQRTDKIEKMIDELANVNDELLTASHEYAAINEELLLKNKMLNDEIDVRKEVIHQLKKSETKMRKFLLESFDGVMYSDQHGQIVEWNPAMERITGLKKETVIQKYAWEVMWQLLPKEQRTLQKLEELRRNRVEYMERKSHREPVMEELTIRTVSGEDRHVRMSLFPISSDCRSYFGRIVRDISLYRKAGVELLDYQKNLEKMVAEKTRELLVAKEKAEESDRLKSAFLANISHEIRTPLNGILGLLNILGADPDQPVALRECIGIINRNSEQLLRLIDDILDVAKIEAGQMSVSSEPVNIDDLLVEMRLLIQAYLQSNKKNGISLEIVKDDENSGHCLVNTDRLRLKQILGNLLSNAVKFTKQGFIRFGYINKGVNKSEGTVTLEFFVEDSGIGIPEKYLETIFDRFYQIDSENNRVYGGTGLGLTISRNLAELMGGYMYAASPGEEGTKIVFTIECKPRLIH